MTEYETILGMIGQVDPEDTSKLDEIDARVWCYKEGLDYAGAVNGKHYFLLGEKYRVGEEDDHPSAPEYTRSRDALKSIRPEGWVFEIKQYPEDWRACLSKGRLMKRVCASGYKTEHLAELHVIIQAIAYERGNK